MSRSVVLAHAVVVLALATLVQQSSGKAALDRRRSTEAYCAKWRAHAARFCVRRSPDLAQLKASSEARYQQAVSFCRGYKAKCVRSPRRRAPSARPAQRAPHVARVVGRSPSRSSTTTPKKRRRKAKTSYCAKWASEAGRRCSKGRLAEASSRARKFCRQYVAKCAGSPKRSGPVAKRRRRFRKGRVARKRLRDDVLDESSVPDLFDDDWWGSSSLTGEALEPSDDPFDSQSSFALSSKSTPAPAPSQPSDPFASSGSSDPFADDEDFWGDGGDDGGDPFSSTTNDEDEPIARGRSTGGLGLFEPQEATTPRPPSLEDVEPAEDVDGTLLEAAAFCERYAQLGRRLCATELAVADAYIAFCADFKRSCPQLFPAPQGEEWNFTGELGEEDPFAEFEGETQSLFDNEGNQVDYSNGALRPNRGKDFREATGLGVGDVLSAGGIAPTNVNQQDRVGFGEFYGQETGSEVDWNNGRYGSTARYGVPMFGGALSGYDDQTVEVPVFNGELGAPIKVGQRSGFGDFWALRDGQNIDWMGGRFSDGEEWAVPFTESTGSQKFDVNWGDGVSELLDRINAKDTLQNKVDQAIRNQKAQGTWRSVAARQRLARRSQRRRQ